MKKEIKLYSTLFILAISALILSGCGAEKNMKKGEKYLAVGEYYDAATQFKRAYQRTAPKEREKRGKIALKLSATSASTLHRRRLRHTATPSDTIRRRRRTD